MNYEDIHSRDMLAFALGVPIKQLTGLLYGVKIENCYTTFTISKKNGSERTISAPKKSLKYVQRKLARLLLKRYEEFLAKKNTENRISHAFFKGKSIKTNAFPHRNKRYVLNVDLQDFFGSIHFGRVYGFFKNNDFFKLPDVATVIAQLTCYEGVLPQGAPTSPIISNLICQILDYKIIELCHEYHLTYTRYADDLTFSTNEKNFDNNYQDFLDKLDKLVTRSGFRINAEKTHFQEYNGRQTVTGLSVNKKLNVKKDFYKKTRSMAHSLYKTGKFMINGKEGTLNQLEGRFSFINDLVKYNNRLEELPSLNLNSIEYKKNLLFTDGKEFEVKKNEQKQILDWKKNLSTLSIREKDYQKFLFYKYFIANTKITIVTEGKTDSKYIKAALRKYYAEYPELVTKDKDGFKYKINFLPRTKRMRYFFGFLSGGGSDQIQLFNYFINRDNHISRNYIKYFKEISEDVPLPQKPTVFLLDNEWETKKPLHNIIKVLCSAQNLNNKDIIQKIHTDYLYHVDLNAFLMTLPVDNLNPKCEVEIENLFDLEKINTELIEPLHDGKKFDIKKEHDDDKSIGKEIFANTILTNYDSEIIDFSNFKPLLDKLSDISKDFTKYT